MTPSNTEPIGKRVATPRATLHQAESFLAFRRQQIEDDRVLVDRHARKIGSLKTAAEGDLSSTIGELEGIGAQKPGPGWTSLD